jgi:uncharacterized protein DUF998
MTSIQPAAATPTAVAPRNRTLLAGLAAAGPLWAAVSLAQAATREGFDLTRHPLSALSTGDLGCLQIANFLVGGVLTVVGAAGLRRAMVSTPGGRWAPRLIAVNGLGMIAAGVLVMDPSDGFPVGTPAGIQASMTWHSVGHMIAGSLSFAALIAACHVLGRHFARAGDRRLAVGSHVAGTVMLLGVGWAMTGGAVGSLTLAVGVIVAMLWIAVVAIRFRPST